MIGPVRVAALLTAGFVNAPPVTADIVLTGFLSGSTDALVMGPTGFPDPADYPGFLSTVDQLYLDPLGFGGQSTALTTPETSDFDPSVAEGGFLNAFIGSLPTEDQSGAIEIADLLGLGNLLAQPHPTTSTRPTSTPSPTTAGPIGRRTSTPA